MKKNNRNIFSEKSNESINFRLVGIDENNDKTYENVEFEIIDEDFNENVEFEIIDEETKEDKSNKKAYKNVDIKDVYGNNKTYNHSTQDKNYSIFNIIISFILEIIFSVIAFSIPILGFILSIVYFIKGEKFSALVFIILAIAGYITSYNLFIELLNSIF